MPRKASKVNPPKYMNTATPSCPISLNQARMSYRSSNIPMSSRATDRATARILTALFDPSAMRDSLRRASGRDPAQLFLKFVSVTIMMVLGLP